MLSVNPSLKKYIDDLIAALTTYVDNSIAAIQPAKIKTGTYLGDGIDNRDIDIGVDLAVKSNVYVIIKGRSNNAPAHRIEYGQGDLTMFFGVTDDIANCIQNFTATGFQVGSDAMVNANGTTYRYIAFWEEP